MLKPVTTHPFLPKILSTLTAVLFTEGAIVPLTLYRVHPNKKNTSHQPFAENQAIGAKHPDSTCSK